jgi:hypothetical protein
MRYVGGLLTWALFIGAMGIEYFAGASLRPESEELYSESLSESRPIPPAPGALESAARLAPEDEVAGAPLQGREDPLLLSYESENSPKTSALRTPPKNSRRR